MSNVRTKYLDDEPRKGICSVVSAGIAAAGAIGGSIISSNAAKKAGKSQAEAATTAAESQLQAGREANQLQWQMYQQNLANQSPYLTGGQSAYAALLGGMGLRGPRVAGQVGQNIGGYNGPTYTDAQGRTVDADGNPVDVGYGALQNYGASQEELDQASGAFAGRFAQQFNGANFEKDPSYQFRLNEGLKALQSSAAARGTLMTGQGLKDINNYAQGAASQEYGAAFDRFRTQQNDLYNRLAGLAGVGQTATGSIGSAGQNAANQIGSNLLSSQTTAGNYLTGGAAAQAAGQVGSANAWAGGLNNAANSWMGMQMLNKYGPPVQATNSNKIMPGDMEYWRD